MMRELTRVANPTVTVSGKSAKSDPVPSIQHLDRPGLWLTRWSVATSDDDVAVTHSMAGGTVVDSGNPPNNRLSAWWGHSDE